MRKRFFNRGMAFFLALLMVVSLLPVGAQEVVAAGDKSEVTTTLGGQTFVVGESQEFTVTTVPSVEDANKMVRGHFEITDSENNPIDDSIMTLEYLETQGAQKDQRLPLSTIG